MDNWELVQVHYNGSSLYIEPIEQIDEATLKSLFPEARVDLQNSKHTRRWLVTKFPDSNSQHKGFWALVSHLGKAGWQPFSFSGSMSLPPFEVIVVLRRNQQH